MVVSELLANLGFSVDEAPLEKISEQIEGVKRRLEFLAAAEVVRGLYELTERFSHFAEGLGTAASSAGVTVEALQKLQYAAGQSGVSADEVSGSLSRLTRILYEARNGSAEARKAFQDAGIPDQAVASYSNSADALAGVSDAIRNIDDPIKRQAIAMQLLGRGAGNMVEFLSKGSRSMRELGLSAEQMGAVVSGKDIEALRDVEDTLSSLWQVVRAFGATIAGVVAPNLRYLVGVMMKFWAANRAVITVNLTSWVNSGLYALGFMVGVVHTLIKAFLDFAKTHPRLIDGFGRMLLVMGALSLGLGVLGRVMALAQGALGALTSGFGPLGSAVGLAWKSLSLFKNGLALVFTYGGNLIATTFPMLSRALLALAAAFNAPLGVILGAVAAVTALVLGLQAAYAVFFKHEKFEDTWLGKIMSGAKSLGKGVLAKLGLDLDAEDKAQSVVDARIGQLTQDGQGALGSAADVMRATRAPPTELMRALDAQSPQDAAAAMAQNVSYDINAPVTINVPSGTDAQDVGQKVKDGIKEHLDQVMRQTRRSLRSPQAH